VNYLLDTCMISELARPAPDARVLKWIESARVSIASTLRVFRSHVKKRSAILS